MKTGTRADRLLDNVIQAASEALAAEELAERVIPFMALAVGASRFVMHRFGTDGRPVGIGDNSAHLVKMKLAGNHRDDMLIRLLQVISDPILLSSHLVDLRLFRATRTYQEFYHLLECEYFLYTRISETALAQPGMTGVILIRSSSERDFDLFQTHQVKRVLPALSAAARRSERFATILKKQDFLEEILEVVSTSCLLATDLKGRILWKSKHAEGLLNRCFSADWKIRDALGPIAVEFGRAVTSGHVHNLAPSSRLSLDLNGRPVHIELFLMRPHRGEAFVLFEIDGGTFSNFVDQLLTEEYALTAAEKGVLALIALGLSNTEIAKRSFISIETARTHVHRILHKLGVSSRVQAALLARKLGLKD